MLVGWIIVGSIIGTFDGWRGNIYRLAVHPHCRRQGVARMLVSEVEKRLADQGPSASRRWWRRITHCRWSFSEAVGYRVDERIVRWVRSSKE